MCCMLVHISRKHNRNVSYDPYVILVCGDLVQTNFILIVLMSQLSDHLTGHLVCRATQPRRSWGL